LEPITIDFTGGREIVYRLKDSEAADLIHNDTVDARRLAGVMNIGPAFPTPVIERLAPLLLQRREKINNASLYGLGWLVVHQLHALEVLDIAPVFRGVGNAAVVTRETAVNAPQHAGLINNFEQDLATGRIFIDGRCFTLAELAFISVLASGGPIVTSPAGQRRSVLQYVTTAMIPMAVYHNDALRIPALAAARWTSVRVEVLMRKLATHLDEEEAWLQGYMRACTVVRGVHTVWAAEAEGDAAPVMTRRWVNSLLEISGTSWPLPGGTNPMWQWAGIKPIFVKNIGSAEEIAALGSMSVHESVSTAHIIGQLLSTGVTNVFIKLNITTDILTDRFWGVLNSDAMELMRTLLASKSNEAPSLVDCPMLIRAAANWVSDYSGMSIDWSHFTTVVWNNRDSAADDMAPEGIRMWTLLAAGAPRIGSVLCTGFLLDSFPDIWCVLAPNVTADTGEDIVHGVAPRYWSAAMGEDLYGSYASSNAAYAYVTYGATLLGVLRQQLEIDDNWPVQVRQFNQVMRQGRTAPGARVDPVVPVEWIDVLGVVQPGTLQTYDWGNRAVLAPEMTEDVLGNGTFQFLANFGSCHYYNAGVRQCRPIANRRINVTMSGLASLCRRTAGMKIGEESKKEEANTAASAEN
jgi:hypothetical protein